MLEFLLVLLPVFDGSLGDTRIHGRLGNSLGYDVDQARVEGSRDYVLFAEGHVIFAINLADLLRHRLSR